MNMLPAAAAALILPLAAALVLGSSFYSPAVQASLNPGNTIMTASDHVFQTDTFSLSGLVGSTLAAAGGQQIVTGSWSLSVENGNVTSFSADLAMVSANGTGYRTMQLTNLTSNSVTMEANGTALVSGTVDVVIVNGTAKIEGAKIDISIAKLRAFKMVLDVEDLAGQPVYGIAADPAVEEETNVAANNNLLTEGSSMASNNITSKFRLPQLPNPFK
jgi:hypothetical protein